MLSDLEIRNIWMEYKEVLKVPICERYMIIVNGVSRLTHKKVRIL